MIGKIQNNISFKSVTLSPHMQKKTKNFNMDQWVLIGDKYVSANSIMDEMKEACRNPRANYIISGGITRTLTGEKTCNLQVSRQISEVKSKCKASPYESFVRGLMHLSEDFKTKQGK